MARIPVLVLLAIALPFSVAAEPDAPEQALSAYFRAIEREGPAAGGRFLDEPSLAEFKFFHLRVFRVSARYQESAASRLMGGASHAELEKLTPLAFYERIMRTLAEESGGLSEERARIIGTVREEPSLAHVVVRWRRPREGREPTERIGVMTLVRFEDRWLVHTSGGSSSALMDYLLEHGEPGAATDRGLTPPPSSAPAAASHPRQ
jgi:hypothetical protein